jgi:hypothetical protein
MYYDLVDYSDWHKSRRGNVRDIQMFFSYWGLSEGRELNNRSKFVSFREFLEEIFVSSTLELDLILLMLHLVSNFTEEFH